MKPLLLAFLLLQGCSGIELCREDRGRLDELTGQLRAIERELEDYKARIERLTKALEAMGGRR